MRRTDLSRRLGKVVTVIENEIYRGKDIEKVISKLSDEIGLKVGKAVKTNNGVLVPYKDKDFEGTLKKNDIISYDSKASELGIKDIKTLSATARIEYIDDTMEDGNKIVIQLIAEAEYKDNSGKKHIAYPVLKEWKIDIEDNTKDDEVVESAHEELIEEVVEVEGDSSNDNIDIEDEIKEDTEVTNTEDDTEDDIEDYKKNIRTVLTILFMDRFFGSVPSEELCKLILDKIHSIYLVTYLEGLYSNIEDIKDDMDDRRMIIKRILDTL